MKAKKITLLICSIAFFASGAWLIWIIRMDVDNSLMNDIELAALLIMGISLGTAIGVKLMK